MRNVRRAGNHMGNADIIRNIKKSVTYIASGANFTRNNNEYIDICFMCIYIGGMKAVYISSKAVTTCIQASMFNALQLSL